MSDYRNLTVDDEEKIYEDTYDTDGRNSMDTTHLHIIEDEHEK